MKLNMNAADRIIRLFIAVIFAVLYFTGTVTGVLGIVLMVIAAIFTLTTLVGFCPLYRLFGVSTCKVKSVK